MYCMKKAEILKPDTGVRQRPVAREVILIKSNYSGNRKSFQVAHYFTVLPDKSVSDVMFCLHCYQGLIIDRSLVY